MQKKKTNEQIAQEGRDIKELPMLTEPQRQLGFQLSLGFRCHPLLNPSSAAILHGVPHTPEAGVVRVVIFPCPAFPRWSCSSHQLSQVPVLGRDLVASPSFTKKWAGLQVLSGLSNPRGVRCDSSHVLAACGACHRLHLLMGPPWGWQEGCFPLGSSPCSWAGTIGANILN